MYAKRVSLLAAVVALASGSLSDGTATAQPAAKQLGRTTARELKQLGSPGEYQLFSDFLMRDQLGVPNKQQLFIDFLSWRKTGRVERSPFLKVDSTYIQRPEDWDTFDMPSSKPINPPKIRLHTTPKALNEHSTSSKPIRQSRLHAAGRPEVVSLATDENASANHFLRDAQTEVQEHETGAAQVSLEEAETRVLNTTTGDRSQRRDAIEEAREALGHVRYLRPDMTQASDMIEQAMSKSEMSSVSTGSHTIPVAGHTSPNQE